MASVDIFIILAHVDFEKNNYQNRYLLNGQDKWVTKSVNHNSGPKIVNKEYADGTPLYDLNMQWIYAIRDTLNIKTEIVFDFDCEETKTERLVKLIRHYGGKTYITCPEAKDKYLDEGLIRANNIEIEYYNTPKHLRKHTFEIFEEYGIDGTIRQLPKREYAVA